MASPGRHESHLNSPGNKTVTLETTHRLTPSISLHVFSFPALASSARTRGPRPSEHITLQFPDDLDPIGGSRNITEEDRCLVFTPCQLPEFRGEHRLLSLLARNGRVTGLLGLPRPQGPLTAQLVSVGGGFPHEILHQQGGYTCISGGTGIACFAALGAGNGGEKEASPDTRSLLWSIRSDDFSIVEHLLDASILRVQDWTRISIFITAGDEQDSFAGGKPAAWWQSRLSNITQRFPKGLEFKLRRMAKSDVDESGQQETILFCGSKSFEWQVKMWALGGPTVYTTERT